MAASPALEVMEAKLSAVAELGANEQMGAIITIAFELLLDIREVLMLLAMQNGAKEGRESGIVLP